MSGLDALLGPPMYTNHILSRGTMLCVVGAALLHNVQHAAAFCFWSRRFRECMRCVRFTFAQTVLDWSCGAQRDRVRSGGRNTSPNRAQGVTFSRPLETLTTPDVLTMSTYISCCTVQKVKKRTQRSDCRIRLAWCCWPALGGCRYSPVRVPLMVACSSSCLCLPACHCVSRIHPWRLGSSDDLSNCAPFFEHSAARATLRRWVCAEFVIKLDPFAGLLHSFTCLPRMYGVLV